MSRAVVAIKSIEGRRVVLNAHLQWARREIKRAATTTSRRRPLAEVGFVAVIRAAIIGRPVECRN